MATSIMVNESTLQLLKQMKSKFHAKSIDETVVKLITENEAIPKTRFGAHPNMKSFTRNDRGSFHEV
jgi:hypothetical protein